MRAKENKSATGKGWRGLGEYWGGGDGKYTEIFTIKNLVDFVIKQ